MVSADLTGDTLGGPIILPKEFIRESVDVLLEVELLFAFWSSWQSSQGTVSDPAIRIKLKLMNEQKSPRLCMRGAKCPRSSDSLRHKFMTLNQSTPEHCRGHKTSLRESKIKGQELISAGLYQKHVTHGSTASGKDQPL
ncbi:hypothetical protein ABVT39_003170 [Epinephelus coioides]